MRIRALVQLLLVVSFAAARAGAQASDSTTKKGGGMVAGVLLGMPGTNHQAIPELFTVGATFTQVHPNHLGADVAIGTMPYLLSLGVVPVGLRLGVALPVSFMPHLMVMPSGGMSFVAAGGPGGAGGVVGLNGGVSTLLYTGQVGLKTSLTWHGFSDIHEKIWLFEVGVVHVPLGLP